MDRNAEYSVWICESSTDQKRWNCNFFSYHWAVISISLSGWLPTQWSMKFKPTGGRISCNLSTTCGSWKPGRNRPLYPVRSMNVWVVSPNYGNKEVELGFFFVSIELNSTVWLCNYRFHSSKSNGSMFIILFPNISDEYSTLLLGSLYIM